MLRHTFIEKAEAEGKYKGRQPTARAKSDEVLKLHGDGRVHLLSHVMWVSVVQACIVLFVINRTRMFE